ncbi:MAG: Metalloprotease MmpA [Microgenomates bacterium OLB22]|nr:MAG: Metalloprotease MmpA [Microgenomates bacterium OLB22]
MSILIFFIVLSILVVVHELGHYLVAKACGIKVEEFGLGIPPRIGGIRIGETLYSINLLPFGGFVKVFGEEEAQLKGRQLTDGEKKRSFVHKPAWQQSAVLVAGVVCNFILGWAIMSYLFTQGVPVTTDKVIVQETQPGSPAAKAGFQKDDIISQIMLKDGSTIETPKTTQAFISIVSKNKGKELVFVTTRKDGQTFSIEATPRANPPEGQGALGLIVSDQIIKKYSPFEAPILGLKESVTMTLAVVQGIGKMVTDLLSFSGRQVDVVGPVGIYYITSSAAQNGFTALLQLVGLLSLNLAVVNILPIPALDGGRLAMVLYEKLARRKIKPALLYRMNTVGFGLLIGLIILITVRDFLQLDTLKSLLAK